jgi:hypothetical protein
MAANENQRLPKAIIELERNTAMELIDRYVNEVGRHLPRKTRGDIQAELRSLLLDSMDAGDENELSEEQVVAALREFGPPKEVAASYYPKNQYLIGPELYPFFRLVTGIVLAAVLGALLVAMGVNAIINPQPLALPEPGDALKLFGELAGALLSTFGSLVLTFVILQRFNVRPELEEAEWDPRKLPPVEDSDNIDRRETVIGMAFALVILAILWFFPGIIGVVGTWGQSVIINQVIVSYIPLISVALLLGIVLDLILLRRGRWSTGTRLAKIGINLFDIYVLYLLLAGHTSWLTQNQVGGFFTSIEALSMDAAGATEAIGMHAFRLAFGVALVVTALETVGLVYQLIKRLLLPASPVAPTVES